ncbi:MAG: IS30 family transposase [Patescibacteria group bacterium]
MKYTQLTVEEREKIQEMLWQKASIRAIATALKRNPSTISREINKNKSSLGKRVYIPRAAHERALTKRKSRGRKERLKNDTIREYVIEHLKGGWSPEQIAGRLSQERPSHCISYETIYQYIYAQFYRNGYGYLKSGNEDLRSYLKRRHKRRQRKGLRKVQRASRFTGSSIEKRPAIVDKRNRIGDWESDSIESFNHMPGLNSLLERKSGLILISKLLEKTANATTNTILKKLSGLPVYTLTMDNGSENQSWKEIEDKTGSKCFYAHPYSSWERGSNENGNGLVRWYFPKKTDFQAISDEEIAKVEYALNTRPRKRLGWRTPLEVFSKELNRINIENNMISVAVAG